MPRDLDQNNQATPTPTSRQPSKRLIPGTITRGLLAIPLILAGSLSLQWASKSHEAGILAAICFLVAAGVIVIKNRVLFAISSAIALVLFIFIVILILALYAGIGLR